MTESTLGENPTETTNDHVRRTWVSRLIEIAIWVAAPLGLGIAATVIALVLGAPQTRAIGVFALIALIAGGYFMWRPNRRLRVRRARAAGLLYTALIAFVGIAAPPAPNSSAIATRSAPASTTAPTSPIQTTASAPALSPEQLASQQAARDEQRRVDYIHRLDRELEGVTAQSLLEQTDTPDNIVITVVLFSSLASIYTDGATMGLSPEQEGARRRFKARVISLQTQVLPQLRSRYASVVSRRVWENDMEVRSTGTGNRTIDFIWSGFAANRNIAQFHSSAAENLEALRFKRVRYFWYRGADRWQYYTLDTPNDGDLAQLQDGRWVVVH